MVVEMEVEDWQHWIPSVDDNYLTPSPNVSERPSVPGWVEVYLAVLAPSKICGFQERIMRSLVLQLWIESAHSDSYSFSFPYVMSIHPFTT